MKPQIGHVLIPNQFEAQCCLSQHSSVCILYTMSDYVTDFLRYHDYTLSGMSKDLLNSKQQD